ncbi:MAG: two-component regulator propeller domain-containing protein, partial [Bacteroidota bacterium]
VFHDGQLWVGTSNHLISMDPESLQVTRAIELYGRSLITIQAFQGKIWVGSSKGLSVINEEESVDILPFENFTITALESDEKSLLVGTRSNGMYVYQDGEVVRHYHQDREPMQVSNQINDIKKRSNGTVWIATNSGINVLDADSKNIFRKYQHRFSNWQGIADTEIRHIFEDNTTGLWLATPLNGINMYHDADNLFEYYGQRTGTAASNELMSRAVISVTADQQSKKLWVGSRKGLSAYDYDTQGFTHYPFVSDDEIFSNQIFSIVQVKKNEFWLGTERGLVSWNFQQKKYKKLDLAFEDSRVNDVYLDSEKNIWVGTSNNGLWKHNSQSKLFEKISDTPRENGITLSSLEIN